MSEGEEKLEEGGSPVEMGMGMAKKMMAQMGKGGPNPMAMMQKMTAQTNAQMEQTGLFRDPLIRLEHLQPCIDWWVGAERKGREATERAWEVTAEEMKARG